MTNIPTDLLRTFIAVVDLRSFTRAAQTLGVTQPAVSTQIKRLQALIGAELFDKSAPGVTLTAKGEIIVGHARRLLSINDQILDLSAQGSTADRLRIGIPNDHRERALLRLIASFRAAHPELHVQVHTDPSDTLLREFRRGEYDLILASADEEQPIPPRWSWPDPSAWAAASPALLAIDGPIPLVVLGEGSLTRRVSVKAFEEAGVAYEIVYVGKSYGGFIEAISAGLGVGCWAKRAFEATGLHVFDHAPRFPKLADVNVGIYVGEGREGSALKELANAMATIRPTGDASARTAAR